MPSNRVVVGLIAALVCLGSTRGAFASGCPGSPSQSVGPDVMVTRISGTVNFNPIEDFEAFTIGADACNLGNQEAQWQACPATTHPVFGGTIHKWHTVDGATRFEQVGQGWLKHGFGANQYASCCSNCQSAGTLTRLGRGCSDAYVGSQSAQQVSLGPKSLVNPHTGIYPQAMCSTHPSGGNMGRIEVRISDLTLTPGGDSAAVRFFNQFQYVTADDSAAHNQNNNASSRELTVSQEFTDWYIAIQQDKPTYPEVPAIRLWKTIDINVVETDVNTPEDDGFPGLVIMAAKATDLGNGFWHYEYAVSNLNSDRSIGSFSVPCSVYATVQNVGFRDVDYRGGDGLGGVNYDGADWPAAVANGEVTWATTPFASDNNANAIRWGTQYNFRFDADVPPAPANGNVDLKEFKVVVDISASTVVPSAVTCTKGDLNGDSLVDGGDIALFASTLVGGGATPIQKCAGDVQASPNGSIDDADVDPFTECLLNSACP